MSGNCSICLGAFIEPVCIPCGHVYCTQCLASHVNSSNEITATCPTCRSDFCTVLPDLTYLPKKYHQYVLPAVRRVYLDNSTTQSLQKKLVKAEARIKKLENHQDLLMKKCEGHIAASQAHALSEYNALQEIERLKKKLNNLTRQMEATDAQHDELEQSVGRVRYEVYYWKSKYNRIKGKFVGSETLNSDSTDNSTQLSKRKSKKVANLSDPPCECDESLIFETPQSSRQIKPIPRRVIRSVSSQHSQSVSAERSKRPRVSLPALFQ